MRWSLWILLLLALFHPSSGAFFPNKSPVRNLQVLFRHEVHTINDVSSVDDLLKKLQARTGLSSKDFQRSAVLHKLRPLDEDASLKNAGVADGDHLLVVPQHILFPASPSDSSDDDLFDVLTYFVSVLSRTLEDPQMYQPDHLVTLLGESLGHLYVTLRFSLLENPLLLQFLLDPQPEMLEAVRITLLRILPSGWSQMLFLPSTLRLLKDSRLWKRQVQDVTQQLAKTLLVVDEALRDIALQLAPTLPGLKGDTAFPPSPFEFSAQNRVKSLQVRLGNRYYPIREATTVQDVYRKLDPSKEGISRSALAASKLYCQGRLLQINDKLRDRGITDGARAVVLTSHQVGVAWDSYLRAPEEVKGHVTSALRKALDTVSIELEGFPSLEEIMRDYGVWSALRFLKKQDVVDLLKTHLESSYKKVQEKWDERNLIYLDLNDDDIEHIRIGVTEAVRQVFPKLSKTASMRVLDNSKVWRRQFRSSMGRWEKFGDAVMIAFPKLLVKIPSTPSSKMSWGFPERQTQRTTIIKDPSEALQMLEELSDSESENDW